jgi:integrase
VIVKQGHTAKAHNAFSILRRVFNWAVGTSEYGLETSPMVHLKPKDLIGRERGIRDRVLTDDELKAVWNAADKLGYPYGTVCKLLILTGQRLREIAGLSWPEIDLDQKIITIPSERMKNGIAYEVPLAPQALAILNDPAMPRWSRGPYVFSPNGAKPAEAFSYMKGLLDRESGVDVWVIHDLRRTARSHWSALPVEERVRELAMAHAQPGLHKVYDRASYRDQKLRLFTLWEAKLAGIIQPMPPAEVIPLAPRRKLAPRPAAAPIVPLRRKVEPRPAVVKPVRSKLVARTR